MKKNINTLLSTLALFALSFPGAALAESASPWPNSFSLETGITMVTQNTMGNNPEGYKDTMDYSFSADVILTAKIDETQDLVFVLEAGDGHSVNDNITGNRANVNYDAYITQTEGMTRLNISQAYYQSRLMGEKLLFAVGKMDVHSLTDGNQFAGDETSQFLNNLFVRSSGVVFHELANYYAPTILLEFTPVPFLTFTATYASPDGYDIIERRHIVVEMALHTQIGEGDGNYRFGFMMDTGEYTKIGAATTAATDTTTDAPAEPAPIDTSTGFYVSVDQGFGAMFGVFGRYVQMDNTFVQNEVISAISGGISINNLLGNEGNSIGVGYGLLEVNTDVVKEYYEGMDVLEAYVRFGVSEHSTLTLDFQMLNDLERGGKRTVTVGGLRFQTNL
ncbi:MAG: carbohydrate porin [Nitrospinota bacterium]|nr:carbohydrate porin [Nitrospinota bacterium]